MPSCCISAIERENLKKYGCSSVRIMVVSRVNFAKIGEIIGVHDGEGFIEDVVLVSKHPLAGSESVCGIATNVLVVAKVKKAKPEKK